MAQPLSAVVLASAERTTSGTSTPFSVGATDTVAVLLDVTAVSGTSPSMTVTVEWSNDGTNWFEADTADNFAAITTAKKVTKSFAVKGTSARLSYAITGTSPSFTFAAHAVTWNGAN